MFLSKEKLFVQVKNCVRKEICSYCDDIYLRIKMLSDTILHFSKITLTQLCEITCS